MTKLNSYNLGFVLTKSALDPKTKAMLIAALAGGGASALLGGLSASDDVFIDEEGKPRKANAKDIALSSLLSGIAGGGSSAFLTHLVNRRR